MRIERLRVQNFRSFREINIEPPAWAAVVGANASGKSNFVQVFRFLRDIVSEGFENAISLQGGVDYLCNMRIGTNEPLQIELSAVLSSHQKERRARLNYSLEIGFTKRRNFKVNKEELRLEPEGAQADPKLPSLHLVRQGETVRQEQVPQNGFHTKFKKRRGKSERFPA